MCGYAYWDAAYWFPVVILIECITTQIWSESRTINVFQINIIAMVVGRAIIANGIEANNVQLCTTPNENCIYKDY